MINRYSIVLVPLHKPKVIFHILFFLVALLTFVNGKFLFGCLFIIIALLGYLTGRKKTVYFSSEKIVFPSYIPKEFSWVDIANVILKDDILTIDFKNNKLIQSTINSNESIINEQDFNEFCRLQINNRTENPKS